VVLKSLIDYAPPLQGGLKANGFKIPLEKGDEILEHSYMPIKPDLGQPLIFDGD